MAESPQGCQNTRELAWFPISRTVVIPNPQGLHARPAMQFVTVASHFKSHIRVRKGDTWANGKDPMDMMLLASPKGTELELIAEGEDAAGMLDALATLVVNGFGEM